MEARKIHLHSGTVNKLMRLKKDADEEGEYRVAKRIHAIILNHDNNSSGDIAQILKAPRSKVSEWLKNYEQHGFEALLEGYRSGCPGQLTEKQKNILADIVESGPVAYGFISGIWTAKMINQIIQDEFAVRYSDRHVRRILDALGFSVQRPRRKLANADESKQNRWKRYIYPDLKKKRATIKHI
jgi:transposase